MLLLITAILAEQGQKRLFFLKRLDQTARLVRIGGKLRILENIRSPLGINLQILLL